MSEQVYTDQPVPPPMSHKEILEKAIQKAIDGGWDIYEATGYSYPDLLSENLLSHNSLELFGVIFNHDFAKALWGDEGRTFEGLQCSAKEGVTSYWTYHLQKMVIAPDPIKYLSQNI